MYNSKTKTICKCPFCDNRKVSVTNSLSTLFPEIASQWHPTLNGNLIPSMILPNSSVKAWWKCDKGENHVWQRIVAHRTHPRSPLEGKCPFCQKVDKQSQSLAVCRPDLAKEWDYEKNGDLLPSHVSKSSAVRVWWKCEKGHEWQTTVNNRTSSHHSGCPYCNGHIVSPERSLAYLYPAIAAQWHPTKNGSLTPSMVFPCSDRLVWWVCTASTPKPLEIGEIVETISIPEDEPLRQSGCGKEWQEGVVSRVTKYKTSGTLCWE